MTRERVLYDWHRPGCRVLFVYRAGGSNFIPMITTFSVASGEEGEITKQIIEDVIADSRPSVSPEQCRRFEEWGARATVS